MNKKLKILLIVSLAVNLFLAGVIAGSVLKPHRPGGQMMQREGFAAIHEFMKSHRGEQKALRAERRTLLEMLKEENFDQAKFDAQINKVGEMQTAMYKEFMGAMAQKLRALPADQRNESIDNLLERMNTKFAGKTPGDRKGQFKRDGGKKEGCAGNAEKKEGCTKGERKGGKKGGRKSLEGRHNRPAPDTVTSATPVETAVE